MLGIILLATLVLVGCPLQKDKSDSGSSGNYTITNKFSASIFISYQLNAGGDWTYITAISAGQSWRGNIPSNTYALKAFNIDNGDTRYSYYPPIPGTWVVE